MKLVRVNDFVTSPADLLEILPREQELVVTDNGNPIALLVTITDCNLEDVLSAISRAKAMNAVKLIQRQSVENGTDKMTPEEIDGEIRRVRKEKRSGKGK